MYRSDPPCREGCVSPAAGRALSRQSVTLSSFSCWEPSCPSQGSPHPVTGHGRSIKHLSPLWDSSELPRRFQTSPLWWDYVAVWPPSLPPSPQSWVCPLPSTDADPWSSLSDTGSSWKSHNPWLSSSLPPSLSFFSSGEIWTPSQWKYWAIQIINAQKS